MVPLLLPKFNLGRLSILFQRSNSAWFNHNNAGKISDKIDVEGVFLKEDVQELLKKLTGLNAEGKIFSDKKVHKMERSHFALMTEESYQDTIKKMEDKGAHFLQFVPLKEPRPNKSKILEKEEGIAGFDESKFIFTDITFDATDQDRTIVVRETDGTLRTATPSEHDRMNRMYYEKPNRPVLEPALFSGDDLKKALDTDKHEFVLDWACWFYEPDDPNFVALSKQVFDQILLAQKFDILYSTRHYGPFLFYCALNKEYIRLLNFFGREDRLADSATFIKLYKIVYPDWKTAVSVEDSDLKVVTDFLDSNSKSNQTDLHDLHMLVKKIRKNNEPTHGAKTASLAQEITVESRFEIFSITHCPTSIQFALAGFVRQVHSLEKSRAVLFTEQRNTIDDCNEVNYEDFEDEPTHGAKTASLAQEITVESRFEIFSITHCPTSIQFALAGFVRQVHSLEKSRAVLFTEQRNTIDDCNEVNYEDFEGIYSDSYSEVMNLIRINPHSALNVSNNLKLDKFTGSKESFEPPFLIESFYLIFKKGQFRLGLLTIDVKTVYEILSNGFMNSIAKPKHHDNQRLLKYVNSFKIVCDTGRYSALVNRQVQCHVHYRELSPTTKSLVLSCFCEAAETSPDDSKVVSSDFAGMFNHRKEYDDQVRANIDDLSKIFIATRGNIEVEHPKIVYPYSVNILNDVFDKKVAQLSNHHNGSERYKQISYRIDMKPNNSVTKVDFIYDETTDSLCNDIRNCSVLMNGVYLDFNINSFDMCRGLREIAVYYLPDQFFGAQDSDYVKKFPSDIKCYPNLPYSRQMWFPNQMLTLSMAEELKVYEGVYDNVNVTLTLTLKGEKKVRLVKARSRQVKGGWIDDVFKASTLMECKYKASRKMLPPNNACYKRIHLVERLLYTFCERPVSGAIGDVHCSTLHIRFNDLKFSDINIKGYFDEEGSFKRSVERAKSKEAKLKWLNHLKSYTPTNTYGHMLKLVPIVFFLIAPPLFYVIINKNA
uniref:28S ribosomal protein S22, mitochondrial n=1 Tax=Rhabditophanes sp. KR3021 TaxID=114890 RepID=A0AC35U8V2_9BILA